MYCSYKYLPSSSIVLSSIPSILLGSGKTSAIIFRFCEFLSTLQVGFEWMLTCGFEFWYLWTFFFFLRRSFTLITQAGVQWRDLGSLQPLPPKFKQFSCLGTLRSQAAGITGARYHAQPIFCIFNRGRVSPCLPDWSQTPHLVICPPQPPKVPGLQAWATTPSLNISDLPDPHLKWPWNTLQKLRLIRTGTLHIDGIRYYNSSHCNYRKSKILHLFHCPKYSF